MSITIKNFQAPLPALNNKMNLKKVLVVYKDSPLKEHSKTISKAGEILDEYGIKNIFLERSKGFPSKSLHKERSLAYQLSVIQCVAEGFWLI